ncbi:MAG: PQQ-binding-like beta-propeller repeat protein [Pirellulaceae bacterium]|nr:PQQ-binding-like beta-propeller repeat protein [Pirellulaceae bacterium]
MEAEPTTVQVRRRPRFSLRTLLIAFVFLGVVSALYVERLRDYLNDQSRVVPTGFDLKTGKNILWQTKIGTQSYAGPVVADGKVFVGTNNQAGFLERYPSDVDLGVLLCLNAKDGSLLWQASSEKLKTGRVHDWPMQGITCTPTIEKDRLYYVTNRCELVCLDTEGFRDGRDDGVPEPPDITGVLVEADVVWKLDMMGELNVSPHNASCSSPCIVDDYVYVVTGNAVDESHINIPSVDAPSFIAVHKKTGRLIWSDNSPGGNILHGQWGSPIHGVFGRTSQVIFPGGDGWLYSFDPKGTPDGKSKLLWKFDCNPKDSVWKLGGSGTRNNVLATPTIHGGLIYVAMGQDPEHGEGDGRIWCIDPTKRGDVSPELVFNNTSGDKMVTRSRTTACDRDAGDFTRPNPNSAAVWEYTGTDLDGDGEMAFEETMHRSLSRVVIKNDLVFISDLSGLLHCLDAKQGRAHWIYDLFAQTWSTPVVSAGYVFAADEDGDVDAFKISSDPQIAMPSNNPVSNSIADASIYGSPTIQNNVLYLMSRDTVYAIADPTRK